MTIQNFFDSYEGLWIDFDGAYPDQCVDLYQTYGKKVIGAPYKGGNAADIWNTYPTDFYDQIANTPTGVPHLGDVIIWGTKYGPYGHIAVCTDIADVKGFTSFDQNDPAKSRCHFQPHNYFGVLGWLRPHSLPMQLSPLEITDQTKIPQITDDQGKAMEVQAIRSQLVDLSSKTKQLDGFISKWVEELKLPAGSNLVEIEADLAQYLPTQDILQQYREAIEEVVGLLSGDNALLTALRGFKSDSDKATKDLTDKITELENKLSNRKVLYAIPFLNWLIKIYPKE
ncbi:MAG: CHAP domain-containing protein [Patescibacteria group bacterium]